MPPITVLAIENQPLTRLGIKALFSSVDDIDLLGDASTPEDGFRMFREMKPDVTLLGLRFPGTCTIDDLEKYFAERPAAKIVILAEHAGDNEIKRALKKGAAGYVLKNVGPSDLLDAVRTVHAGRKYIPSEIAGILSEAVSREDLTAAEASVLQMIVGGMSNKEIAFALDVSENTVKSHVQNIFGKLGVSDRTSAATLAIKRGLVRIDI
jgi:two-component system, NarL family, response regulator